ncbi:MAG: NAD(P)/FAD-dependent oxidoreductase [Gammaproteobacteria bacterium]|nr:NAD(P)/FAD-dependent oxidoreductase [Gammaproteobacteria bacterium]
MGETADVVIVGAGVIGLATGRAFARSGREVIVLEQNSTIGSETSSRNSGVIHAGIYYPKNSLKAQLCVRGKQLLYAFCRDYDVEYKRCGKLIVASDESELPQLQKHQNQALANGVYDLHWLKKQTVQHLEPQVRCVAGLLSPSSGVVDTATLLHRLQADLEALGGSVVLNTLVNSFKGSKELCVEVADFKLKPNLLINCAGLTASSLAQGLGIEHNQFFAKGQYFEYPSLSLDRPLFQHLIYPVATPETIGIHITVDLQGTVKFGPDVQWIKEISYDFDESRKHLFAKAIKRYYPSLVEDALRPGYTGIRTKLVSEGHGFVDFRIRGPKETGIAGYVEAIGIDSPGLTSSLAIGEYIVALAND